ncbi:Nif3-like dinuclear metal center hexameric protein [Candidatus Marinamargulisbacteria bacterium SCGC AG-343-D04]|nr:Nif3-like dinuclear metal center hexameric protein [Candidatus Marinamargulisbacteria bacterium SCGC AG-343-D04]
MEIVYCRRMTIPVVLSDIQAFFDQWAPAELAASWDNVGIQIGAKGGEISECLVSLEVDEQVLAYLEGKTTVAVITHHPLFFKSLKRIDYNTDMGQIISAFVKGEHALFSAHTNLDAAEDGVNDCLIESFGLDPKIGVVMEDGFGKYIESPNITYQDLLKKNGGIAQGAIHNEPIKRLGFCAGSGHGLIGSVLSLGCDTFVTGEVTYHDHVTCRMNGVRLITLGHKESENMIVDRIATRMRNMFKDLEVTALK